MRFLHPALSVAGKSLGSQIPHLAPPAVQHIGVHLSGAGNLGKRRSQIQPPDGLFLKLFRELPSRQSHSSILHLTKTEPLTVCLNSGDKSRHSADTSGRRQDRSQPQEVIGLEIRLRPGSTYKVRGTVAGLPALETNERPYYVLARRQSSFADDPAQPGSQVNAKGGFELTGLTPGPYDIEVTHTDLSHGQFSMVRLGRATVQVGNEDLNNVVLQAAVPRT